MKRKRISVELYLFHYEPIIVIWNNDGEQFLPVSHLFLCKIIIRISGNRPSRRSNLLFGDIQGKFEEGVVVLTGSKYQLRKLLDAVNLS
ncbi:hypothetical protein [Membranihabitans maritimus]|uniref:hypothetical protein n=1 Tax=Membranihabitans maritimus TaxID=2904244 RepID=UPI001F3F4A20|nr:hypothetical protein [Membranihabitans maritimus]